MAYERFKERYPTEQSRIEAGVGLPSPDTKMPTILAMEPDNLYTKPSLYKRVLDYCGLSKENFPVTKISVWSYCDGDGKCEGSLHSIGCVVKRKYKKKSGMWATAYGLTDFGEDIGKPICNLGIKTVNELWKKRNEYGNYSSMWKIIGACNKPEDASHRGGYTIAMIIKYLIENPGSHTREDIAENLEKFGINDNAAVSYILNKLGKGKIIDYKSPLRDEKGKRTHGWSKYIVKEYIELGDRPKDSNGDFIFSRKRWNKISEYFNKKLGEEVNRVELAEKFKIALTRASTTLTHLERVGKIENLGIKGREKQTEARANELTKTLYYELLKPTMDAVINLDPEIEEFKKCIEYYQKNPDKYREHLQNTLCIFGIERTKIGNKGGKEIRKAILKVLKENEKPMKVSYIHDEVLEKIDRDIQGITTFKHLKKLEAEGKIKSPKKRYYGIAI